MRHIATLGVLSLLLSGCAGAPTDTSSATTTTPTTTTTTTTTSPFEPETTDPQDCFDGICTIRVSEGTTFPLDADAFGLSEFVATAVEPGTVECKLYVRPRGAFTLTLKEPGQSAAGHLDIPTWVTLVSVDTASAVIAIGHTTPP